MFRFLSPVCTKASILLLITAVFSVVIVTPFTQYPFVFGKIIFFRVAVELALVFFLLSVLMKDRLLWRVWLKDLLRSPLALAVTVFVFIFSLAGFLGYDWQTSFWSNYVRGEGIFQMWHYYAFFVLLVLLFRDEKLWRWLLRAAITAGLLSIILGIPEYLQTFQIDHRFKTTIGNPAFAAIYLSFALFYILLLYLENRPKLISGIFHWSAIIAGLIFLLAIILGGTRGAFLSLIAGLAVWFFTFFARKIGSKFFFPAIIVAIVVIGGLFYWQPIRVFQISFQQQTLQTRLWTWRSALRGWSERPILGWGPENFSEVFNKHFDQRHHQGPEKISETWFDRAHNVFIGYLTETGLLGLASYLAIWIAYYLGLYRLYGFQRFHGPNGFYLFLILPIVYLLQVSLLFETLPAYINLFLFLALTNCKISNYKIQTANKLQAPLGESSDKCLKFAIWSLLGICSLALGASFYLGNYLPLRKSMLFIGAIKKIGQLNSFEEFKSNFSQALDYYAPYGQDEQLKMLGGVIIDLLKKDLSPEVAKALADYLDWHYQPILARGRGNIFAQNYYILIKAHQLAGNLDLAKKYQREAAERWSLRPEFKVLK